MTAQRQEIMKAIIHQAMRHPEKLIILCRELNSATLSKRRKMKILNNDKEIFSEDEVKFPDYNILV